MKYRHRQMFADLTLYNHIAVSSVIRLHYSAHNLLHLNTLTKVDVVMT